MTEGAEDPLVGALLGDRYRVGKPLDSGGMGAVYEARDEMLSRRVVVKVMHPHLARDVSLMERFRREALAAAALNHPHIVQTTDFAMEPGKPAFMVMEYLKGVTFTSVLRDEGRLPPARVVHIAAQVLDALAMTHQSRIVHRDLKPSNIFLTQLSGMSDVVKLLDFGIAKLWDSPEFQRLTRTGQLVGTPLFMAPEQLRGEEVDGRVDLYALGVNMFGGMTGRPPYLAAGAELVPAILTQEAPTVADVRPDVDPALSAVVARAMAKDKNVRFQNAEEMRTALTPWLASSVRALHATPAQPMPARVSDAQIHAPISSPGVGSDPQIHVPTSSPGATVVDHTGPQMTQGGRPRKSRTALWVGLGSVALVLAAAAAVGVVFALDWMSPEEEGGQLAMPTPPPTTVGMVPPDEPAGVPAPVAMQPPTGVDDVEPESPPDESEPLGDEPPAVAGRRPRGSGSKMRAERPTVEPDTSTSMSAPAPETNPSGETEMQCTVRLADLETQNVSGSAVRRLLVGRRPAMAACGRTLPVGEHRIGLRAVTNDEMSWGGFRAQGEWASKEQGTCIARVLSGLSLPDPRESPGEIEVVVRLDCES